MKTKCPATILAVSLLAAAAHAETTNCLPRPVLAIARQGSAASLRVAGEPGLNYAIEGTSNFTQWTRYFTNRSSSGKFTFTSSLAGVSHHFFRVVTVDASDGLGGSFIFDGNTFAGWEGDTAATFRVLDCAIVGGSLTQPPPPQNRFLCTTRRFTNFVLRLEFRLLGTNGFINSGVQFRSERVAGTHQVSGYQADLGPGYWGSLYDESRRNTVLAAANQSAVAAVLKTNDWNRYEIRAEGSRIRFWINDYQTIDYTETVSSIPRHGLIALQVHSGGTSEASFRRITLEVLP